MNDAFFVTSKIAWILIRPETWLIILVSVALIATLRNAKRVAIGSLSLTLGLFSVIAIIPVGNLALLPLETWFPGNPKLSRVDGIIILGGAEQTVLSQHWSQPQLGSGAERIFAGLSLARQFPDARIVYTDGSGTLLGQSDQGATIAGQIFSGQGINPDRLVIEDQARNTLENALLSKRLVQPKADQNWVLVTSAHHMPRAVGVFCKIGWAVFPYPVDYRSGATLKRSGWNFVRNLYDLNIGVKEWVGLLAYWLTGKTAAFLPKGC